MASRRKLKKSIGNICSDLIANCSVLHLCGINDQEKTDALLQKVLGMHHEYITRISHTEKGKEQLFYRTLREEFTKEVNAIEKEING